MRQCKYCRKIKADRCHHCSQCNKCILKMDHHCPWVVNCIGFYNYKYFLNMLFYVSMNCWIIILSAWGPVVAVIQASYNYSSESEYIYLEELDMMLAYFIVASYSLAIVIGCVISFFFMFHIRLVMNQYTTIEFIEKRGSQKKKDKNFQNKSPYDLGSLQNLKSVFGPNIFLWLLPVQPEITNIQAASGNGLFYDLRSDLKREVIPL